MPGRRNRLLTTKMDCVQDTLCSLFSTQTTYQPIHPAKAPAASARDT